MNKFTKWKVLHSDIAYDCNLITSIYYEMLRQRMLKVFLKILPLNTDDQTTAWFSYLLQNLAISHHFLGFLFFLMHRLSFPLYSQFILILFASPTCQYAALSVILISKLSLVVINSPSMLWFLWEKCYNTKNWHGHEWQ